MRVGDTVVINQEAYDVVRIEANGDVLVQHIDTQELKWVDFYVGGLRDPHTDHGAILEALSSLGGVDVHRIKSPGRAPAKSSAGGTAAEPADILRWGESDPDLPEEGSDL
jgi:hypothetical protein